MKKDYPYSYLTILPSDKPRIAYLRVVAANKAIIEKIGGLESDFIKDYSRELYLFIPHDYKTQGCHVYGGKWIDKKKLMEKDVHFHHSNGKVIYTEYGYQLCVGTPGSFSLLKNVILENVKTAEHMLIAYEQVMTGMTSELNLLAYAHGSKGIKQFENNKNKYIIK